MVETISAQERSVTLAQIYECGEKRKVEHPMIFGLPRVIVIPARNIRQG